MNGITAYIHQAATAKALHHPDVGFILQNEAEGSPNKFDLADAPFLYELLYFEDLRVEAVHEGFHEDHALSTGNL